MEPDKTQQLQDMTRETFPYATEMVDKLKKPFGYKGGKKKKKKTYKKKRNYKKKSTKRKNYKKTKKNKRSKIRK